jgi:hypothetical protein
LTDTAFKVAVAILGPLLSVGGGGRGDVVAKVVYVVENVGIMVGDKVGPYSFYFLHELREFAHFANPNLVMFTAFVNILAFIVVECTTEVPHRSKIPFLICTAVFVQVATAVE